MYRLYRNLFCVLFEFWEKISWPKSYSDWKAELSLDFFAITLGISAIMYYTEFTGRWVNMGSDVSVAIIYILFIAIPNYLLFHHKNQWRTYLYEFRQLNASEKRKARIAGYSIILLVIANFCFAMFVMDNTFVKK